MKYLPTAHIRNGDTNAKMFEHCNTTEESLYPDLIDRSETKSAVSQTCFILLTLFFFNI